MGDIYGDDCSDAFPPTDTEEPDTGYWPEEIAFGLDDYHD